MAHFAGWGRGRGEGRLDFSYAQSEKIVGTLRICLLVVLLLTALVLPVVRVVLLARPAEAYDAVHGFVVFACQCRGEVEKFVPCTLGGYFCFGFGRGAKAVGLSIQIEWVAMYVRTFFSFEAHIHFAGDAWEAQVGPNPQIVLRLGP